MKTTRTIYIYEDGNRYKIEQDGVRCALDMYIKGEESINSSGQIVNNNGFWGVVAYCDNIPQCLFRIAEDILKDNNLPLDVRGYTGEMLRLNRKYNLEGIK